LIENNRIKKCEVIIIDGANVALVNSNKNRKGNCYNIQIIENALSKINSKSKKIIISDASLYYKISDRYLYLKYKNNDNFYVAPANTNADYFILKYSQLHPNSVIISNDLFREFNGPLEEVKKRRIAFMIIDEEVIFFEN